MKGLLLTPLIEQNDWFVLRRGDECGTKLWGIASFT